MKTVLKYSLALLAGLSVALSCSKMGTVDANDGENAAPAGKQIIIHATLADAPTRVEYTLDESGEKPKLTLKWESTDALLVSNASGSVEIGNPTIDETGKTATFSGTLPEGGEPYTVAVKHAGANLGATQTQAADGDLKHLEYAAMAEGVTEADFENLALTQTTGVLGLIAKIPTVVSAAVKAVIFQTESNLFNGSNTLTVNLTQGGAGVDNILYVYANVAAASIPAGTEMFIRFKVGDGENDYYTRYQKFEGAVSLTTGALNGLKLNCTHIDRYAGKDDKGTAAAPYLIADKYQLDAMHNEMSEGTTRYFKLLDDIDLSGVAWIPLCNSKPYTKYVDFDGNGKTISHLTTKTDAAYPGFFGVFNGIAKDLIISEATIMPTSNSNNKGGVFASYIGTPDSDVNPTVTNITIRNSSVGASDNRMGNYTGALCGQVENDNAAIRNITVSDTNVYGATNSGAGGVIGYIRSAGTFEKMTSDSDIIANQFVGGIVGAVNVTTADGEAIISKCWFTGNVSAGNRHVGGIVGGNVGSKGSLTVSNCYVTGNMQGSYGGGILGLHQPNDSETTSLENCYVTGSVKGTFGAGGIVGNSTKDGLSVIRCMPFNSEIKALATDAAQHYSSGAVIAYAKSVKVVVNYCYRISDMPNRFFECPGNSANVIEQHAFITSPAAIPQRNGLTYGYYHHGRKTAMTLCDLVHSGAIGKDWSSEIWDWTGDIPTLK